MTGLVNGKKQILTTYRIETPKPIDIKFGTCISIVRSHVYLDGQFFGRLMLARKSALHINVVCF